MRRSISPVRRLSVVDRAITRVFYGQGVEAAHLANCRRMWRRKYVTQRGPSPDDIRSEIREG